MNPTPPAPRRSAGAATRRAAAWALVSALAVLSVAFTASAYQRSLIEDSARAGLEVRADAIEAAAATEVARYLGVATVVAHGLASRDEITEEAFRSAAAGIEEMGLDGATSIVYVAPPVSAADVPAAQVRWRRTFAPDLELAPVDSPGEHIFTLATVSLDGTPDRPGGIDVTGAAAPYAALMESRRSGTAAVSDAYTLIIDQELSVEQRQASFSLVVPIDDGERFLGWVLIGLRGQDFLGHVLDVAGEGTVDTVLRAGAADGTEVEVASIGAPRDGEIFDQTRTLEVAQQEWSLNVGTDVAAQVGPSRLMPRNTRIGGIIAALLLGTLIWVLVTGRQRSEQKVLAATADLAEAEATSRRQAVMLDAIVETIDEIGVSVVDAEGRFVLQSRAAREILGVDEAGGRAAFPDTPGQWQEAFGLLDLDGKPLDPADTPLIRALHGESTDAVPMLIRNDQRPEGTQIEMSGRPLALGDGRHGALAVFRDVTLERMQQAELAGFAGVVAHDLRHPLTIISGYVGLLADHCLPALEGDPVLLAEAASYLAKVAAGSRRMGELISDLLEYTTARDAEMTWRSVDLRELALEAVDIHADAGKEAGRPGPHLHVGDLPVVEGDLERLRQLFANLVGNAVKYVAPGAVPLLDISASEHDGRVRLRFADRGIGIDPDKRGDVFRPFVRAHTNTPDGVAYTGTGLGLAICHQVVQRHGGDIAVSPNPGGGSVFTVDLPMLRPRTTPREAAQEAPQETQQELPQEHPHETQPRSGAALQTLPRT